jgi:hypothetical protein
MGDDRPTIDRGPTAQTRRSPQEDPAATAPSSGRLPSGFRARRPPATCLRDVSRASDWPPVLGPPCVLRPQTLPRTDMRTA